jgi:hypothetical protein
MPPSARFFLCALCRVQVVICRDCDRGQHYCSKTCSRIRRIERQRDSNVRYAKSRAGRLNNAQRQARFRARQRDQKTLIPEKVTDQGIAPLEELDTLVRLPLSSVHEPIKQQPTDMRCHVCSQYCDPLLRSDFLRAGQRHRRYANSQHDTIP